MRNPWPLFLTLAATGGALVFCDKFLSYRMFWVVGVAAVILFFGYVVLYAKYNAWLACKLNPYILDYQNDHDIEKLKKGFEQWESWAVTGGSKNSMSVNLLNAYLGQYLMEEFAAEAEKLKERAFTTQEWVIYHSYMAEYAKCIGDHAAEEKERRICRELGEKAARKRGTSNEPATAGQSRRAFWLWFSLDLFLFAGSLVCAAFFRNSPMFSVGVGAFIFSGFMLPVVLGWLVIWLKRRLEEKKRNYVIE